MPEPTGDESEQRGAGLDRYSRQTLFGAIGSDGQNRLARARATLIGCGALGTVLANTLVRAGLGRLLICDRDFIEYDNLQRQMLFTEDDIAANLPKAEAAAGHLRRCNSTVTVDAAVTDVNAANIEQLTTGADIILDGTDNFDTRYLINELAVKTGRPWIYGAVIGATGLCMTVVPGHTPCLCCIFEKAPPPEMNPTCDTAGVIGPIVGVIAGLQAAEALKLLTGNRDAINRSLVHVDLWTGRFVKMNTQTIHAQANCPCCKQHRFPYLKGESGATTTTLCGRDAVQIAAGPDRTVDFQALARKLQPVSSEPVRYNRFMLRARVENHDLTLFPDGRMIIKGTDNPDRARSLYAKYVGA